MLLVSKAEHLYLLTENPDYYHYELKLILEGSLTVIQVNTSDQKCIQKALQPLKNICGMINSTDTWGLLGITIASQLGLPCQNFEIIQRIRDKSRLRNYLHQCGLSSGKSITINQGHIDVEQIIDDMGFPLMVKDSSGTGSQHVWLAENKPQLIKALVKAQSTKLRGSIAIETYFNGTLYSAETLSWQGETKVLAISSRMLSSEPAFLELASTTPVQFPVNIQETLIDWLRKLLLKIGYTDGFTHTEFIVTPQGFEVVEINPRLGGCQFGEVLCQLYNANIYQAYLEIALGQRPQLMDGNLIMNKGFSQIFVNAKNTGYFNSIVGLQKLENHPGNPIFYPSVPVGKRIEYLNDSRGALGSLVASGETAEIAQFNAFAAISKLNIVILPTMCDKPHLLIIGGWSELLQKAIESGYQLSYIGSCQTTKYFDASLLTQFLHVHEAAINQIGYCLSLAQAIHEHSHCHAVISFSERGLETAAVISTALGINGLELFPTMTTRYKDRMRDLLNNYPNLTLPWKRILSREELEIFYQEQMSQIIVKPIDQAGSVGVQQIKSADELSSYCNDIFPKVSLPILAEKLIDSDITYSVETLSSRGQHNIVGLSFSKMVGYPYAIHNYIIVPPPELAKSTRQSISEKVIEFLKSIRLNRGVAHTEVKVDQHGKPYIIESQTRVGGDRIWKMVELTTGIKQIDLVFKELITPIELPETIEYQSVAGSFCLLPPPGEIRAIANPDFLSHDMCVFEYEFNIKPGEKITAITNNTERKGFVFLEAPDHQQLFNSFNSIAEKLWVEYTDGSTWYPIL